jgi:hypothetical protein
VMEKYRQGIETATQPSSTAAAAKISDVGK